MISIILPFLGRAGDREEKVEVGSKREGSIFWQQFHDDSLYTFRNQKGYVPMLLHNFGEQALAPFHMTGRQALWAGGITATTIALFFVDEDFDRVIRPIRDKSPFLKKVSPQYTELGDYYGYALLCTYGGYSLIFHKHKALHTAVLASQAAITAGVWIRVGKILTGRMRPGATYGDLEYNSDHWFGPFAQFGPDRNAHRSIAGFDAFPSGHTGAAFSMATVFALRYSDHKAVPWIAYTLASLVGISRLLEHEHWASDVVAGGAIGYICGRQVVSHYKTLFPAYAQKKKKKQNGTSFFTLSNSGGRAGFQYVLIF